MNRPAFRNTRFTIGCKGFQSHGVNEKGLSLLKASSTVFVVTHAYAKNSPEECRKRMRAESGPEPHSGYDSSPPSRAFSIFNPKMISAMGFSPEVSRELEPDYFKRAPNADPCMLDPSPSSSETLDFDILDELQDFDFWCNELIL